MMDDSLFSANWHKVRDLKPRLAEDVRVSRQFFRGVSSHLLNRESTGRSYRLDSRAFDLVSRLDGNVSVDEVWLQMHEGSAGDDAPSQSLFMELLGTLHGADLLVLDRRVDIDRLFQRQNDESVLTARQRLASPLYLRFKLFNPDSWLTRLSPWSNRLFTRPSAVLWVCLLLAGLVCSLPDLPVIHAELQNMDAQSAGFVALFVLLYSMIKMLHELGHACAIKRFGGAVREMGVALMVLLPNPYTDASAASLFADKRQRMLVSAAGIMVELALASMAAIVWSSTTGLLHHAALMVMVTGGVSTLLFNGNPLMKFDGYHVLSDWIEIPNLAGRSRRYVLNLLARRVLRQSLTIPIVADNGERAWLIGYAVLSAIYRFVLMLTIAWMLSGQYFFFGVLLAIYVVCNVSLMPLTRLIRYLSSLEPDVRRSSVFRCMSIGLLTIVFMFGVPLPHATTVDGVVWLPEEATLRAELGCEVTSVLVEPGSFVDEDTSLLACQDAELDFQLASQQAKLDGLTAQAAGLAIAAPIEARRIDTDIALASKEMKQLAHQKKQQLLTSRAAGQFLVDTQQALEGQYYPQGAIIGYVIPSKGRTIRLLLSQDQVGGISSDQSAVSVAVMHGITGPENHDSHIIRQTPKPVRQFISPALTQQAGGQLAVETDPEAGVTLAQAAYDLELAWPSAATEAPIGQRVRVRIALEASPLAGRVISTIRQAFIGRLST